MTKITEEEMLKILDILDPHYKDPTGVVDKLTHLLGAFAAKNCYVLSQRYPGNPQIGARTLTIILANLTECLLNGFDHLNNETDEDQSDNTNIAN